MWELLSICAFRRHRKQRRARGGGEVEDRVHAIDARENEVDRVLEG